MPQFIVLSTKKLMPSLKLEAMKDGIAIIEQEFIHIQPILSSENASAVKDLASIKNLTVAFTSLNAVDCFLKLAGLNGIRSSNIHWNIFCLEGVTQNAVVENLTGCNIVETAVDSALLAKKILGQGAINKLVFFCGNKRRNELPDLLNTNNLHVQELIVYETLETPVAIPGQLDAIMFFSPSAVNSFFSVNKLEKNTVCFAIGATTAKTIATYTTNKIISNEVPSQLSLVQSLRSYFQNIN